MLMYSQGQGAQFPGMGKQHYDTSAFAKRFFDKADELLGFKISDVMFNGTEEDLRQTNITQPANFCIPLLHIVPLKMQDLKWLPVIHWVNSLPS